jgi:hypothetical protein
MFLFKATSELQNKGPPPGPGFKRYTPDIGKRMENRRQFFRFGGGSEVVVHEPVRQPGTQT